MDFARNLNADFDETELDSSSGCELSFEMSSDNIQEPMSPCSSYAPKKLDFGEEPITPLPKNHTYSPPYKRVRALRLFDAPLTPKTILEKSNCSTPGPRGRLFGSDKPRGLASAYPKQEKPAVNINPFTPNALLVKKKRTRSIRSLLGSPEMTSSNGNLSDDSDEEIIQQPSKRIALRVSDCKKVMT